MGRPADDVAELSGDLIFAYVIFALPVEPLLACAEANQRCTVPSNRCFAVFRAPDKLGSIRAKIGLDLVLIKLHFAKEAGCLKVTIDREANKAIASINKSFQYSGAGLMDGTRQANSGNFPLGPDAADLGPVDLKVVMAEARKLANALSDRATELGAHHLRPAALAAFLRKISWRETPSRLQALARHVVDHRQAILDAVLTALLAQLDQRVPAATRRLRVAVPSLPLGRAGGRGEPAGIPGSGGVRCVGSGQENRDRAQHRLAMGLLRRGVRGRQRLLDAGVADQIEYLEKLDAAASRWRPAGARRSPITTSAS